MTDTLPSPAGEPLAVTVRFLQPEVRGPRRSKLVGKGTLAVDRQSLSIAGKRMLPFWAQLLMVVGAAAASLALLGIVAWPVALAILFFVRLRHHESWPAASVRSVAYEPGRRRFLVIANVEAGSRCVAWRTLGDSAPLAGALRQQFEDSFREAAVRGWRTY